MANTEELNHGEGSSSSIIMDNQYELKDENPEEELNIETEEELKLRPKTGMVNFLQSDQFENSSDSLEKENANKQGRRKFMVRVSRPKTIPIKIFKVTCRICFEDTDILQMHSVHDCLHRSCSSCVKKHVEVKLRQGTMPKCPHLGCNSDIIVDRCTKVLSPEVIEVMNQRVKESQIPVLERIYCPDPRCSNLMSKSEVLNYSKNRLMNAELSGRRICLKCHSHFCVNCKVPWHSQMTCADYKMSHPYSSVEDEMLSSLAERNSWKQCVKCSHMIELDVGCYHIKCRCGHQFCYRCGAEWKNDKASCSCPLWDEHRIIY